MISLTPFDVRLAPTVAHIQSVVAAYHRLNPEDMRSARRSRRVAWPRQTAMYLTRELTPKSLPNIGRLFGNRDHTTVMHAIAAVERRAANDAGFAKDIEILRSELIG